MLHDGGADARAPCHAGEEPEGYALVVPRTKSAWRWGPVDLLEAIGETGLVNLATLDIVDAQQQQQQQQE